MQSVPDGIPTRSVGTINRSPPLDCYRVACRAEISKLDINPCGRRRSCATVRAAIRTKRWISEQMSHQIHRLAAVVTSGVSHRDRGKLPELRSLLILLLSTRQSRRHPSRLGCRLNAGGVEWAERHECRSAACPRSVACARPAKVAIGVVCDICARHDRSHAPRGNAVHDAARHSGRRASWTGFPRGAWERSIPVGDAGGRWYGPRFGRWRWVWWLICSLIHRLAAVVTSGVSHRNCVKTDSCVLC
jgi:hypothetical protein